MSIQDGFATALRLIRATKGLTQKDLAGPVTGSHVSQLESGKTSPTVKAAGELAQALGLSSSALLAVAVAADSKATPKDVLLRAISELEILGLADQIPSAAQAMDTQHPTSVRAAATRAQVQALKSQGLRQVDVAEELGIPKTTVQRHWH
ncbi:helix-turn-helix transcriptional regulator [Pseudomonas allii]|jgi:transcriptional regulator with XRE-family HTH domain|uniref:Helix-turn-helix transcriptional regulator n=1 Tax=Pseudomonas allii TaxID=2740531 RepID=A0ACC6LF63_9PSED|nr:MULTISPECIES: helix-turn-helix transcriptional regulator [Pseudomonas]MDR9876756.1 helix-turn-helix transcriptional regulator [Pseudomonas allii]MDT8906661.1 helix-turn-helix transcriptional regulator [Pseudomonas prosekii]NLT91246.1 helix-turn-helix transcriptional regulator [Pseudomonas lactis]